MTSGTCGCEGACPEPKDGATLGRRQFLATSAAGTAVFASSALGLPTVAGPFGRQDVADHFVPADKKLRAEWLRLLFERGAPTWYSGADLDTIGMPIGGIAAGQLYLTGDGRLVHWDLFNREINTGYGALNYEDGRKAEQTVDSGRLLTMPSLDQGFALEVRTEGGTVTRSLDRVGFPRVQFCGEYPLGRVRYRDQALPVEVDLEACSPFIPLDAENSSLPATLMQYTVRNKFSMPVAVTLRGWLENAVCRDSAELFGARFTRHTGIRAEDDFVGCVCTARPRSFEEEVRPPEVFADFEGGTYGSWQQTGEAFGSAPAGGTLTEQNPVSGFLGEGLVNTFLAGDQPHGALTSPPFTIQRPYVGFLIGGGAHAERTCMHLVVDGQVVRTATGRNNEHLEPHNWNVEDLAGRTAHLEIVDAESGAWGHVNVDQIEFRDQPMVADPGPLESWRDFGSLCLATEAGGFAEADRDGKGSAGHTLTLGPGEARTVTFVLSWHMPNRFARGQRVGHQYATRFADAEAVALHVIRERESLVEQTRRWHQTLYDSTLPHWLLDRLHSTMANLATSTCQWWENGRFWAWEGVGCCHGTCGHVWNYAHGLARLFPRLERSVREMQDFHTGAGFQEDTGAIGFRGEGWSLWAGDSQGGYILKALREHQTAPDAGFLQRLWPRIRQGVSFLIDQDGDGDGLLEGKQHQTYDQDYYGANTMVGSLYLGALRAAEELAREVGDRAFAAECRKLFESGREGSVQRLFNGEYFIQEVDLAQHPEWQYGEGCLADQLFGQGWAHQVGLGHLYPRDTVVRALQSIWKYCWAPDVASQNQVHAPERWFARAGEAGLFTCTWPRSRHLGPRSTRYRNEIWTGIEYQVAGHMAWEGMVTEALAICRGVHERYHPSKRNPWNEIECGDHYARSLASWGVLLGLAGFEYHGPKGHLGFAPRITPEDFRCAFTAAEGWGSLTQQRAANTQANSIEVRWGSLGVRTLALDLAEGAVARDAMVTLDDVVMAVRREQTGPQVVLHLSPDTVVSAGSVLRVRIDI